MDAVITILEFKNHMKAMGYAEATIKCYSHGLDLFKRYLIEQDITDLRKITHEVILSYQAKVMSEPIAINSKALKIRPVKRLFEHLTAYGSL